MPNISDISLVGLRQAGLLIAGALTMACTDSVPADNPLTTSPIRLDVAPTQMGTTRLLVEDNDNLKTACTPTAGGRAIGIWSSYELSGQTVHNVLGNPTGDVALTYRATTEWDNYQGWTYGEEAAFWTAGAKYTFNAYYPMDAVDEISSSDESTFVIDYNTEHYQEDLMTAYAYADTGSTGFNASTPVQLNMLHTLAAVKFKFLFMNADGSTYDDSDRLTACWLENTISGEGFATTGILAFGTIDDNGDIDGEHIHWYHEDHPEPSTPTTPRRIYAWEDASGVAFSSTTTSATAATSHSTGGGLYASNDGWLLIIPQQTNDSVQLCFRLKTTGDMVHRINLPATTFDAGKRYTFNIRFGQSGVELTLSIADWNELKSSHNVAL